MRKAWSVSLVCLAVCLMATTVGALAQRYSFKGYDQHNDLNNLAVRCILQDRRGLLWVGTEAGIFRFDGFRFEQMPMLEGNGEEFISGLAEDGRGRIWFSTSDTLGYFEGEAITEVPAPGQEFAFGRTNQLLSDPDDPNRIYFVNRHALFSAAIGADRRAYVTPVFSTRQIGANPRLGKISGLAALAENRLWLGCGEDICSVHGNALRDYGTGDGLSPGPYPEFFIDRSHTVWARSDHHIVRFDPQTGRFTDCSWGLPAASLNVRQPQLFQDPQGRILANLTTGLARYLGGAWEVFREHADLPPYQIEAFLIDRQGSIWLGLDGHGIVRWLGYNQWEGWSTANGLSSDLVWNLTRDPKGNLWIANEANLELLRPGSSKPEPQSDARGASLQRVQTIVATPDGHIWSGSGNGEVIDFDPATRNARVVGRLGGVFRIFPGDANQLWICAMDGLFSIDRGGETTARHLPAPAPQGRVFEGARDASGGFWFITESGLYRLSHSTWTHIQLPASYHTAFSAQIAVAQDGTLWLSGTRPALIHLRIHGDTATELQRFNAPPLNSNTIYLAAIDRRGWLWAGTDRGLDVYNGSGWRHITADDGLIWNDTDGGAFYDDNDGSIWIGTSGGVAHMMHPESIFQSEPLSVYLSHVEIGKTKLMPGGSATLGWSHQPLTAELSTLDFANASVVTFRYRIEGVNEDWQDTPKHDLRYPPLAPGHYRLAVIAVDSQDGRQSPPTYVTFVITPPWWHTNAVYVAEALFAIVLLLAVWHLSLRRHLAKERHLEELVLRRTRELEMEKAELLRTRAALEQQASHDALTGLLNHGAILHSLGLAVERCLREKSTLGVVLADVDHFKWVNDTHGHVTGDLVLQEYGRRAIAAVRPYDEVGRYGGEEILFVLPGFEPTSMMERLTELHSAVSREPFDCGELQVRVTSSFGFAWLMPGIDTVESLIERADRTMYKAKENGRNRIEVCEDPAFPRNHPAVR
jgi:diguanylate cyclase (GGDEF)-like protein